jgi:hypothetical protein
MPSREARARGRQRSKPHLQPSFHETPAIILLVRRRSVDVIYHVVVVQLASRAELIQICIGHHVNLASWADPRALHQRRHLGVHAFEVARPPLRGGTPTPSRWHAQTLFLVGRTRAWHFLLTPSRWHGRRTLRHRRSSPSVPFHSLLARPDRGWSHKSKRSAPGASRWCLSSARRVPWCLSRAHPARPVVPFADTPTLLRTADLPDRLWQDG